MAWTRFWDMHSGGSQKEKAAKICIEAPRSEAIRIFEKMFGHDPLAWLAEKSFISFQVKQRMS